MTEAEIADEVQAVAARRTVRSSAISETQRLAPIASTEAERKAVEILGAHRRAVAARAEAARRLRGRAVARAVAGQDVPAAAAQRLPRPCDAAVQIGGAGQRIAAVRVGRARRRAGIDRDVRGVRARIGDCDDIELNGCVGGIDGGGIVRIRRRRAVLEAAGSRHFGARVGDALPPASLPAWCGAPSVRFRSWGQNL